MNEPPVVPTDPPEPSAHAALTRHDLEGTILAASPAARAVLGRAPEALVGLLLPVLAHPEDTDAITQALDQLGAGFADPIALPCRLSLGGGRYRRLEVTFHALPSHRPGEAGTAIEIAALWRPAATAIEHEQGEKTALTGHVRRLKRRLESVISSIPGVVWEAWRKEDPRQHRTDFVSDYIEKMTGFAADEWLRRPSFWETMIGRAPLPLPEAPDLPPEGPVIRLLRWTTKDGRTLWVESFVQPIRDTNGDLLGARGVSLDVTARNEAEEERARALEEARRLGERLDEIVASVPGIVWETRFDGETQTQRYTYVSEYAEQLTGYGPVEWLERGLLWENIVHPDDLAARREQATMAITEGKREIQQRIVTRDGRVVWTEVQLRPVLDEQGKIVGLRGVTLNIDQRKRAEAEQERLREEVLLAQQHLVDQLSTPLIPITERALVMPLIGEIAGRRGDSIVETLLRGIADRRAEVAILDITGVPTVDPGAAHSLVRAAMGARLLGARVILTGLRPDVARYLVSADVDLTGITTCGTLQDGIRIALGPRLR
ncbi:MAG TPA: PAS domain S-box protein [Candidatus Nanopelagicales bacterium]|nr:PAS domain S-box protein [Candidatus Nanopelagicales bacterium]